MHYDLDSLDNRDPARVERMLAFTERFIARYHRAEVRGVERIPAGAALYVGNHNAGFWSADTYLFCAAIYRAHGLGSVPYGLAHEVAVDLPLVRDLLVPLGAVRASHENARRLFARGSKVLVYPGGDLESMRPFRERNRIVFGGRTGYMKLALREGVPIVPLVAAGAHSASLVLDDLQWLARALGADKHLRVKVWPLMLSFPLGLTLGPLVPYVPFPSRILAEVQEPLRFERTGEAAANDDAYVAECDERVRTAMQAALTRLAAEREGKGSGQRA